MPSSIRRFHNHITSMLNSKDYLDKKLLKIGAELDDLQRRRYVRVTLDEPIQRGWRRFHVLTAKAKLRPDSEILEAILLFVGTLQFRNSPDFRKRRGSGRRKRFFEIEQPLRELTVGGWEALRLPESCLRYFRLEERNHYRAWLNVLVFVSPHVFELKIEPNWVTEVWEPDPAVSQRIAEIENWLSHRNRKFRLNRLQDRSCKYWCLSSRQPALEKLAECEMRDAISGLSEADPVVPLRALGSAFRALFFLYV